MSRPGRGQGPARRSHARHIRGPDQAAFDLAISTIDASITKLKADLAAVTKKQKENSDFLRNARAHNNARGGNLAPHINSMQGLRRAKHDAIAQLKATEKEIRKVVGDIGSTIGIRLDNNRSLADNVRLLETRLHMENMSLAREKEMVKQISALRIKAGNCTELDKLYARKRELSRKLDSIKNELQQAQKDLNSAKSEADDGQSGTFDEQIKEVLNSRPILEQAYQTIKSAIDEEYKKKKDLYDSHWESKREHKKKLDEWYTEQRQKRRAQKEKENGQPNELFTWVNPSAQTCDYLVEECQRYLMLERVANAGKKKQPIPRTPEGTADSAEALNGQDGLGEKISKKEYSNKYSAKKGKRKPKRKPAAQVPQLSAATQTQSLGWTEREKAAFTHVGVATPDKIEDVRSTITELKARRKYFASLPPPQQRWGQEETE